MNYGIKISQEGVDLATGNTNGTEDDKQKEIAHILSTLALPYLNGAVIQIERYRAAFASVEARPVDATLDCLHEVSCLFEDLATVAKYIEMCDETNDLHQLFWDIRNLIRHDIRDKFDNNDSWKKNECARRLKMPSRMQAIIGFDVDSIKVGGTTIELVEVVDYLKWASIVIASRIEDARKKGFFPVAIA